MPRMSTASQHDRLLCDESLVDASLQNDVTKNHTRSRVGCQSISTEAVFGPYLLNLGVGTRFPSSRVNRYYCVGELALARDLTGPE